jgi:hypothetical protein
MKKLEASMRDQAAKSWKQNRVMYKIGSYFKNCENCSTIELVEVGDNLVKRYRDGGPVYRSYCPRVTGWTYYCHRCSAKDGKCWDGATDIGQDAIRGTREAVRKTKYFLRKEALRIGKAAVTQVVVPSRAAQIAELERKIRELEEQVKGGK